MNRSLSTILLELRVAEAERARFDRQCQLAPVGSPSEDEASDLFAAADDRVEALRDEAKALIHSLTGVRWHIIEGANL